MTDGAAIEVRGLTKRYGATVAVDDLTFPVPRGSVTGFLGPNGAGKTTTLRVRLGLAEPTNGLTFVVGSPPCGSSLATCRGGANVDSVSEIVCARRESPIESRTHRPLRTA